MFYFRLHKEILKQKFYLPRLYKFCPQTLQSTRVKTEMIKNVRTIWQKVNLVWTWGRMENGKTGEPSKPGINLTQSTESISSKMYCYLYKEHPLSWLKDSSQMKLGRAQESYKMLNTEPSADPIAAFPLPSHGGWQPISETNTKNLFLALSVFLTLISWCSVSCLQKVIGYHHSWSSSTACSFFKH